jgi:hypothetical protein
VTLMNNNSESDKEFRIRSQEEIWGDWFQENQKELDELKAENKRLRQALEEIAKDKPYRCLRTDQDIAREALKESDNE